MRNKKFVFWITLWSSLFLVSACSLSPGLRFEKVDGPTENILMSSGIKQNIVPITVDLLMGFEEIHKKNQEFPLELIYLNSHPPLPYQVGVGDRIDIVLWDQPEFNKAFSVGQGGFVVNHSGHIDFPYIGLVRVQSLTVQQIRELLIKSLGKYIKRPQLSIRVVDFRSQKIVVEGELKNPGMVPLNEIPMTLAEAISRAGGYQPLADQSRLQLLREGRSYQISLKTLFKKGLSASNILLKNGDWLKVPSREEQKIWVMGEVGQAIAVMMRDGELTLNDALIQAGGINTFSGDPGQIYVIRDFEKSLRQKELTVYHLNAKHVVHLALANHFPLQKNDIVFVDSSPVVRWNKVLNMLLPSAQSIQTLRSLSKGGN
jgi:polysaccharide export outer membrane protein